MNLLETWESTFNQLGDILLDNLTGDEHLVIEMGGEQSHFMRFNRAQVRQSGIVTDATVKLRLITENRTAYASFPFTGDLAIDSAAGLENLGYLREILPQLPEDPYVILPQNQGSSHEVYAGQLLPPEQAAAAILENMGNVDFTGLYTSGPVVRANRNSAGQKHWFVTETFVLDYSMITPTEKAVKSIYAGSDWNQEQYEEHISQSVKQLVVMERPVKTVPPGKYRTYFAPEAVAELISMLSWGAVSEASMRQGGSALAKLREGKTLSPQLSLRENFHLGTVPRFNDLGEVAPEEVPIVSEGQLANTLVSSRTAKEYGMTSNAAAGSEGMRSAEMLPGKLASEDIVTQLGTGLYLSNLHYLNWSDRNGGRITGMTRFACFWVEKGEIKQPIKDLRFDESLYSFWGEHLEAITDFQELVPEVDTYEARSLGGAKVPGMLVQDFTFTL
ncbi:MAG: TldD/PmbA family protein [Cyanobacteria bacterium P01_A01_bin.17]